MRAELLLAALLAAGCGDDDAAVPTVSATVDRAMLAAGEELDVTVTVTDFRLVDPGPAPPNRSGEGHYHVYLDDATGGDYLVASAEPTSAVTIPGGTSPGPHMLRVELQQSDHTPVPGAVPATVAITILAPAPTLSVTASPNPVTLGGTLTIDVAVTNFVLDPAALGTPAVPGRGHYHISVDTTSDQYQQISAADPSTWMVVMMDQSTGELGMAPGAHTITISLVNNDHTPLEPPVEQDVSVTVQ